MLAMRAKRHGAKYSLRIVLEARCAGIPISLGFALIEQESGFRNVYGHDPVLSVLSGPPSKTVPRRGGPVTEINYRVYKKRRAEGMGMQGVGPGQLTWWATQDQADRLGGCWAPRYNIAMAFITLASYIKSRGSQRAGIKAYNGSGAAADRYASQVLKRQISWHNRLKGN